MAEPADVGPAASTAAAASPAAIDATSTIAPDVPDDGAARRAALRDLAVMIGVEVFY